MRDGNPSVAVQFQPGLSTAEFLGWYGLRAALFARAREQGVTPSDLVRGVLNEALGGPAQGPTSEQEPSQPATSGARVHLSIRLSLEQARTLASAAKAAGLATGDYITGLADDVPVLSNGGHRADLLVGLIASNAELSSRSRSIHHLTVLLRQAESRAAKECRAMLDSLADDVRTHLKLASTVLAELRPGPGSRMPSDRIEP